MINTPTAGSTVAVGSKGSSFSVASNQRKDTAVFSLPLNPSSFPITSKNNDTNTQ
jgi:hypothetical protein